MDQPPGTSRCTILENWKHVKYKIDTNDAAFQELILHYKPSSMQLFSTVFQSTQHLVAIIGELTTEKGLDQQNYQCKNCARPIGMSKYKVGEA